MSERARRVTYDADGETAYYDGSVEDITARKLAEQALTESEERFRSLYENSTIGLFRITPDDRVVLANPTLLRLLGHEHLDEQACKHLLWAGFDDAEEREAHRAQTELEGTVHGKEETWERADGSHVFVRESMTAIRDAAGYIQYFDGTVEDITERKLAEQALQESEERFRSLYMNSTIGLFRTTPAGRVLLANPTLIKMLRYDTFEEFSKINLENFALGPIYDRKAFKERLEKENEIIGLEGVWTRRDGTTIYVRESARLIRDELGQVLYYDGTVEDITESMQAKQELTRSEERYRSLFEFARDTILIIKDCQFIDCNPPATDLFGADRDVIIGQNPHGAFSPQFQPDGRD